MSNTDTIFTLSDARNEKNMAFEAKYAKEDAKAEADRVKRIREDALMACYPQIGVLQGAKGRKFYAFITPLGRPSECFRSSDIMKVVEAVEKDVAGEFPVC